MSVRFYFVRHGESTINRKGYFCEDENAGLTLRGKAQAAQVGCDLKDCGVDFKAIFCSPYRRARETCRIALEKAGMHGALAAIDAMIGERKYGEAIETALEDGRIDDLYDYKLDCSAQYGVESLEDLEERARKFIDEMVRNYPGGDILIFSHGDFGMAFRAVIEGRPESGYLFDLGLLENGEMMVLEV